MRHRTIWVAVIVMALAAPLDAADWAQWRGPTHDGVAQESSHWPKGWPPKELWRARVGSGCTSPIVAGGRLYVVGWAGKPGANLRQNPVGTDTVRCLDAATGKELWRESYAARYQGRLRKGDTQFYGGPSATPSLDVATGLLFTLGGDGDLHCRQVDKQGQLVWSLNLYDKYKVARRPSSGGGQRDFGFSTSPLVLGEDVLVMVGAPAATVIAFDKRTGKRRWASQLTAPGGNTSGLVPFRVDGAEMLAVLTLTELVVMRTDKGHEGRTVARTAWRTEFACNLATPAVNGRDILLTAAYNNKRSRLLRLADGKLKERWTSRPHAIVSSPVIFDGRVLLVDRRLRCLRLADGRPRWDGGSFGSGSCLVTAKDGKALVFGNGRLALVDPRADGYKQLAITGKLVLGVCYPHVALSDGLVAVKDRDGNLVMLSIQPR
jgi:outer membrane protein assembly factor BamB